MNKTDANPYQREGLSLSDYRASRRMKASKVIRIVSDFIGDIKEKTLLDVGCFDGCMTEHFAQHTGKVIGTDIDPKVLQNSVETFTAKNLKFVAYDGYRLPFSDESIDILIANHVLYYVVDQKSFLSEVYRVIKPDGICYFSVINGIYTQRILKLPTWLQPLAARIVFGSPVNFGHPVKMEAYQKMLSEFTFRDITADALLEPHRYAGDFRGWRSIILKTISKLPAKYIIAIASRSPTHIFVLQKTPT